jgi:hypothetical protein
LLVINLGCYLLFLSYLIFFIYLNIQKKKPISKLSLIKREKKKITKEFGEAKEKAYIGRNIKINKMKYDNVIVDLKPRPVLQELIEDLTNKMLAQKRVLHMEQNNEHADYLFIEGLKSDIRLLDQVIERCYAQQELIDMRAEQIIGLN